MTGSADEIDKIERELDHLRERYATFQWVAVWTPRILIVACVVCAGATVGEIILGDILGAVWFMILLVFFAVFGLQYRKQRPIDVISMPGFGTNAREVEEMIAQRERRLAELKVQAP